MELLYGRQGYLAPLFFLVRLFLERVKVRVLYFQSPAEPG